MPQPLVNITVPVFNRLPETVKTLTSVKKYTHSPHMVTVVDNASQEEVRVFLRQAKADGLIDNLHLLDNNYGISCAVNTGWRLNPADYYMKLDNDIEITADNWLYSILARWQHVEQPSLIGPLWKKNLPGRAAEAINTPDGVLWKAKRSLFGCALMIPQSILDTLGYLNEDYGLYGAEDADYCVRVLVAGYPAYAFAADGVLVHLGESIAVYQEHGINKMHLVRQYAGTEESVGLYSANEYMFRAGIRSLRTPLKFRVESVEGDQVKIALNREYLAFRTRLLACLRFIDHVRRHNGPEPLGQDAVVAKVRSLLGEERSTE